MARLTCPKFGHPALSSEFYNYARTKHSICSGCRHAKKKNSKDKTISTLTVHPQFLQINPFRVKTKILTGQVNLRTLDRVSELRSHYPSIEYKGINKYWTKGN